MSKKLLIVVAVVLILCIAVWLNFGCKVKCDSEVENYTDHTLSDIIEFKRTPVTYAFRGNGMDENPHYRADPGNRLVPLEYGGHQLLDSRPKKPLEPLRNVSTLINDGKLRLDMVESGDVGWHRLLNNMGNAGQLSGDLRPYDMEASTFDPGSPLYAADFHYNEYIGDR